MCMNGYRGFSWFRMFLLFAAIVVALQTNAMDLMTTQKINHGDIGVVDSRGIQHLNGHPLRAVVLDWSLLESVIELGVTPVGAPELDSYARWVVQPAIPVLTEDVGTRSEPNLEKIASLHPDIILVTDSQRDLIPRLEAIAPVLFFSNFSENDDHAAVAIDQFKQLAIVFGKQSVAEQKLAQLEYRLAQLKGRLSDAFKNGVPPVVVMRFANLTSTFLYSSNSIPDYVLRRLGLTNPLPQSPAKWGIVQKPIADLQHIERGYVLYILPFDQESQLKHSILWRAMPFVQQGHVGSVRSVWSYGGAMSIQFTAEAIAESLLLLANQS
jgi:ferric hydroxamate transport system substrate-binding protein